MESLQINKSNSKPFIFIVILTFLALVLTTKFYSFTLLKWYHWIAGKIIFILYVF